MRIVICDDEKYVVEDVRQECMRYAVPEDQIDGFSSSNALREWLVAERPLVDLFILDIEMPELDGLELKKLITELYNDTNIIFLTIHEEMMEDAFGKKVIGFLKKENFRSRLGKVIKEVREEVEKDSLIHVMEGKIVHSLPKKKILSVCSERIYSMVTLVSHFNLDWNLLETSCEMYRISLNQWEQILDNSEFFRINRSCIIHYRYVKRIADKVIMENGESYSISASKKAELRKSYRDYCEKMARCL